MLLEQWQDASCPTTAAPSLHSRVGVLYTIFSLACALALLLLLTEIFNYPLGLKVGGTAGRALLRVDHAGSS